MRSSFNTATVSKRIALTLLIASGTLFIQDGCFSQSAQADPARGGTSNVLVAQGDASLPAPDSNYHPKSRLGGDFSGGAAQNGAPGDASSGPLARMRMRRRLKRNGQDPSGQFDAAAGGQPDSDSVSNTPGPLGPGAGGPGASGNFAGGFGAPLRARAQANGLAGTGLAGNGAREGAAGSQVGGAARRFQGGGGFGLFGKKALDLTSLSLSPEQKQKIQDARRQVAPKTKEIRRQLVEKRAELRDMMFQPDMNDDLVRAKRKEVRQLQDKIEDLQLNDFLAIRAVLTPEQRQKLIDLKPGPKVAAGQAQLIAPAVSPQPSQ